MAEEAAEEAAVAAGFLAHRHARLHAVANLDGFGARDFFANGHWNLLDNLLLDHFANLDVHLLDHFLLLHLANADGADLFTRNPHFTAAPPGCRLFLAADHFEAWEQVAMTATTATTAAAALIAATLIAIAVADDVPARHAVTRLAVPFAFPFAAADLDLLFFPNGLADDLAALADLHLFHRLANRVTAFFHDRFLHGLAGGDLPFLNHVLIAGLVTDPGVVTAVILVT